MKRTIALLPLLIFINSTMLIIGCGSTSSIQALPYGSFGTTNKLRDSALTGNYVLKNDGKVVQYTGNMMAKSGLKNIPTADGQKLKPADIKGYQEDGKYYVLNYGFHEVVADGKISIYSMNQSIEHYNGSTSGFARYAYKTKKGDLQPLVLDRLKDLVKDCPQAYSKLNVSPAEVLKAIKINPRYLNEVVDYYNEGCK